MRWKTILAVLLVASQGAFAAPKVTKVDLLAPMGLQVNAAGPLLIRMDAERNRLVMANTLTSSVSFIDCQSRAVRNIQVRTRVPQYLKAEALAVDARTGNAYVIGDRTLEVVFPESGKSLSFPTNKQFEMVAVDENSGNAFLVGRESREMAFVELKKNRVRYIPWCEKEEVVLNLNQTPPPPIRKVVCDNGSRTVLAVDGYTSTLHAFAAADGKACGTQTGPGPQPRPLAFRRLQPGPALLLVVETAERKVIQAAKIAAAGGRRDRQLPGLTEGVGVSYNEKRDELYIPYDNHASLHIVDFKDNGRVSEVLLPAYGNDASALDAEHDLLYVSSWAYGEIDQVDLRRGGCSGAFFRPPSCRTCSRWPSIPATAGFTCPWAPRRSTVRSERPSASWTRAAAHLQGAQRLGAAGTAAAAGQRRLPGLQQRGPIRPRESRRQLHRPLPSRILPDQALATPAGNVYLSYGPHQSYWPVVYIWAARNGILGLNGPDQEFYDRRIPRLAQGMAMTPAGAFYALQNNWGDEKQFLVALGDEVRCPNQGDMRLELPDTVSRETSQRLLAYDEGNHWLCLARVGEKDTDNGVVQIVDAKAGKTLKRLEIGATPTALAVDAKNIYVVNFDCDSLTTVSKADFARRAWRAAAIR